MYRFSLTQSTSENTTRNQEREVFFFNLMCLLLKLLQNIKYYKNIMKYIIKRKKTIGVTLTTKTN